MPIPVYSRDRTYTRTNLAVRFVLGCALMGYVCGEELGAWWALIPYVAIWIVVLPWLQRRGQIAT